jgi:hypothetical protein
VNSYQYQLPITNHYGHQLTKYIGNYLYIGYVNW